MGRPKKMKEEGVVNENICHDRDLKFVSTGSTNLNLALTNDINCGYPVGKIINLVGDRSIGKSLMCIEVINYAHHILNKKYDIRLVYNDTESALNEDMAKGIGFPLDKVILKQSSTVEEWFEDLSKEVESANNYDLLIYVLDSLDALSSEEELEEDFNKKSYSMTKQKQLSKLFRQLVRKVDEKNVLLIIVSQIRDKIGVAFGETKTRSGGRSLDFYASQIIWLYNKGQIKNKDAVIGAEVKLKIKKNRFGKPFKEANFNILFGYGIDDIGGMIDFLVDNGFLSKTGNGRIQYNDMAYPKEDFIKFISDNNKEDEIKEAVKKTWDKIEEELRIDRKPKYPIEET